MNYKCPKCFANYDGNTIHGCDSSTVKPGYNSITYNYCLDPKTKEKLHFIIGYLEGSLLGYGESYKNSLKLPIEMLKEIVGETNKDINPIIEKHNEAIKNGVFSPKK